MSSVTPTPTLHSQRMTLSASPAFDSTSPRLVAQAVPTLPESIAIQIAQKRDALEFMIQCVSKDDENWKVIDLEEYTLSHPDMVITDKHLYQLAMALKQNSFVNAIRLPERAGLVTWNVLWPLFESLKVNTSISRLFIAASGEVFGHAIPVYFTNVIMDFFGANKVLRSLGQLSKCGTLPSSVRHSLNQNIIRYYVPKKVLLVRGLWKYVKPMLTSNLKDSVNHALSLVYEFDEHLSMVSATSKSETLPKPELISFDEGEQIEGEISICHKCSKKRRLQRSES